MNSGLIYTRPSIFAGDGAAADKCVSTNNNPLKNKNRFKADQACNELNKGSRISPMNNALRS